MVLLTLQIVFLSFTIASYRNQSCETCQTVHHRLRNGNHPRKRINENSLNGPGDAANCTSCFWPAKKHPRAGLMEKLNDLSWSSLLLRYQSNSPMAATHVRISMLLGHHELALALQSLAMPHASWDADSPRCKIFTNPAAAMRNYAVEASLHTWVQHILQPLCNMSPTQNWCHFSFFKFSPLALLMVKLNRNDVQVRWRIQGIDCQHSSWNLLAKPLQRKGFQNFQMMQKCIQVF